MTRNFICKSVAALLISLCGLSACANHEKTAQPPPKEYQLRGAIVRLETRPTNVAVIKHDEIKGWMEPMTMEFPVPSAQEFANLRVGDQITATVYVRDLEYWIGNISKKK